jgi:restriction system protein
MNLFDKHGGYRKLNSFTMASVIQLGTWRFCESFLNRTNDPCGRLFDQMTQAARSGCRNIMEGSERAGTSKGTEMTLTDVARASLVELKGDYEFWLIRRRIAPWKVPSQEAKDLFDIRLDPKPLNKGDGTHEHAVYLMAQYAKFAPWLDGGDADIAANAMLILLQRVLIMLDRQLKAQGESFRQDGGFRERMMTVRMEEREKQQAEAGSPSCPECGQMMRKRTAKNGKSAGKPFWGCTSYPECTGTRQVES